MKSTDAGLRPLCRNRFIKSGSQGRDDSLQGRIVAYRVGRCAPYAPVWDKVGGYAPMWGEVGVGKPLWDKVGGLATLWDKVRFWPTVWSQGVHVGLGTQNPLLLPTCRIGRICGKKAKKPYNYRGLRHFEKSEKRVNFDAAHRVSYIEPNRLVLWFSENFIIDMVRRVSGGGIVTPVRGTEKGLVTSGKACKVLLGGIESLVSAQGYMLLKYRL